jgi:hypothetical protein
MLWLIRPLQGESSAAGNDAACLLSQPLARFRQRYKGFSQQPRMCSRCVASAAPESDGSKEISEGPSRSKAPIRPASRTAP